MNSIPAVMTAVVAHGGEGAATLAAGEAPTPRPGPGQVLIRVSHAGVNRPDILQRKGLYPAPKGHSQILGLEVAGAVAATGDGAARFKLGDRVMALVNGGGYAEYCVAEESACLPIPDALTMTEAGGFPEAVFTVWHNVFERGRLTEGEWFLIHGGTSGIGVAAIQLAKAFGAKVIATAGGPAKRQACLDLGANVAVDYQSEDFVEAARAATVGRGVDVILDMVGGDYVERNVKLLADDGRLVNIAYQNGSKVTLDFMRVMLKRLTLTGSTLRLRSNEVKADIARAVEAKVPPLVESGRFKVIVDSTFPLAQAAEAHRRMEEGGHIGKIILTI